MLDLWAKQVFRPLVFHLSEQHNLLTAVSSSVSSGAAVPFRYEKVAITKLYF
jgi:hypothetical protein